jgi:hypothetical protein
MQKRGQIDTAGIGGIRLSPKPNELIQFQVMRRNGTNEREDFRQNQKAIKASCIKQSKRSSIGVVSRSKVNARARHSK